MFIFYLLNIKFIGNQKKVAADDQDQASPTLENAGASSQQPSSSSGRKRQSQVSDSFYPPASPVLPSFNSASKSPNNFQSNISSSNDESVATSASPSVSASSKNVAVKPAQETPIAATTTTTTPITASKNSSKHSIPANKNTPPPLPPLPAATAAAAATESDSYHRINLRSIKPIDSVDSVAGLLLSKSDSRPALSNSFTENNTSSSNNSQIKVNYPNRFSSIDEAEQETNRGDSRLFGYDSVANDNDNDTSLFSSSHLRFETTSSKRASPITPVINHYEFKKPTDDQSQANGSSLSIKVKARSPVHLKTSGNLMNEAAATTKTTTTSYSPPKSSSSIGNSYSPAVGTRQPPPPLPQPSSPAFNGKFLKTISI